ncbi:hypothetical protein AMIS_67830 [Actinoplanes missouriensis 431]|uniref:Uncharacterized protein n=1 Tax=Actinoplanes missouriensis (strain ATCC 14538 / DSM 43046 / CBS 188.64 / JCM 3121 / NBRC 102363 / NCIMB 12654 / NRRL B-3342 / UNCC 431) TaxID=512565 RepID=I0HG66_ACTM4|nr:hypothetical protein [Actinoplanes missouriensis]BAL92003.1 hypothetical protein AMIS_67830 [Actinoplanes missouriensis 431]
MIWNFARKMILTAILVPLGAAGARKLSDTIERRRGASRGTRLLRQGADTLQNTFGRKKRRRFGFR